MRYIFYYPVKPPTINYGWGGYHPEYPDYFGFHHHNGIDMNLVNGQDVCAPNDGTILRVGSQVSGAGNFVTMLCDASYTFDDGNTCFVMHEFFHNKEILVKEGDHVKTGDVLAHGDTTGYSTGPHSHIESVRVIWKTVNPSYPEKAYRLSDDGKSELVDFDRNDMNDSFDPAPYYATICASDYKLGVTGVAVAESGVVLVPQVPVAERLTFLTALKEFLLNLKKLFP